MHACNICTYPGLGHVHTEIFTRSFPDMAPVSRARYVLGRVIHGIPVVELKIPGAKGNGFACSAARNFNNVVRMASGKQRRPPKATRQFDQLARA